MRPRHVRLPSVLPLTERTPDGDQYLLDGFTPPNLRERLDHLARQAMATRCGQQLPDFGLFDLTQFDQMHLFK